MEALKITFKLATPFVSNGYPIHLDSILGHAYVRHYLPDSPEKNEDQLFAILEDLPIEKHHQEGDWVYKCSALIPVGDKSHSTRFFTRRYPEMEIAKATVKGDIKNGNFKKEEGLERHKMKLDIGRGPQKKVLSYYPLTGCDELVAYCIGEKELIEEALAEWGYITHVGSMRRMGNGFISGVTIEIDESALENWKKRATPWKLSDESVNVSCTTKNPYWDKTKMINGYCHNGLF